MRHASTSATLWTAADDPGERGTLLVEFDHQFVFQIRHATARGEALGRIGRHAPVIVAIREGLPEDRALETVTINPAAILEVDDRVGSLEVGKDADILLFGDDPLDGRNKVGAMHIEGDLVFEADGPYLPS